MTEKMLKDHTRDLDALGDWLLAYYRNPHRQARGAGQGLCG